MLIGVITLVVRTLDDSSLCIMYTSTTYKKSYIYSGFYGSVTIVTSLVLTARISGVIYEVRI